VVCIYKANAQGYIYIYKFMFDRANNSPKWIIAYQWEDKRVRENNDNACGRKRSKCDLPDNLNRKPWFRPARLSIYLYTCIISARTIIVHGICVCTDDSVHHINYEKQQQFLYIFMHFYSNFLIFFSLLFSFNFFLSCAHRTRNW